MTTCCEAKESTVAPAIDADELALLCKALAHPARVELLNYLSAFGACYFGSLTDVLPLAASTISQHVSVLKQAGLITGSANEQRVYYCVNAERLAQLKQMIANL
ncbi:helix-turn-helix transcriptional regulator [Massilia sp. Dwa41.01b]|uniref:ArsR/SmtB family transcription factor n=1 Tax=unclassified Massilia TaxID=2609279 RepID=UPI0015FFFFE0|nr:MULTISPECIES: metalloregulator ArsR/SmtB family transcription factor [unclassified Massilia]QNA89994.1 helix-turn-helix transcriptional regulator [Massilia sp. Dwa41.01b]QNB00880.1 helix-turn-helix transcriptional regulator [Massilia sp. Se16.2.3]